MPQSQNSLIDILYLSVETEGFTSPAVLKTQINLVLCPRKPELLISSMTSLPNKIGFTEKLTTHFKIDSLFSTCSGYEFYFATSETGSPTTIEQMEIRGDYLMIKQLV